jgi:hypothetical protein
VHPKSAYEGHDNTACAGGTSALTAAIPVSSVQCSRTVRTVANFTHQIDCKTHHDAVPLANPRFLPHSPELGMCSTDDTDIVMRPAPVMGSRNEITS